jgi:hypothetical protein
LDSDNRTLYHYALQALPLGGRLIVRYLMNGYVFPTEAELRAMPGDVLAFENSDGTFLSVWLSCLIWLQHKSATTSTDC